MSSLVESPEYQAFRRFVDLTIEKRELQARLDELKETLKAMQPALLAYLAAANMGGLTVNGYLISPRREPWIYPMLGVSRQRVCEALKVAGLGRMVSENYNTRTLTSYIRQLEEHARLIAGFEEESDSNSLEKLPGLHPALAEILHVKAAYSLQIKKSGKEDANAKYHEERFQNDEGDESDDD